MEESAQGIVTYAVMQKKARKRMSKYIKTDALDELKEITDDAFEWGVYVVKMSAIREVPTADVVEVVRCCDADKGDCMFNHWHETPNGDKYHICNLNQLSFSEHDNFYCAYGKRREK